MKRDDDRRFLRPRKAGAWTPEHTQRVVIGPLGVARHWALPCIGAIGVLLLVVEIVDALM